MALPGLLGDFLELFRRRQRDTGGFILLISFPAYLKYIDAEDEWIREKKRKLWLLMPTGIA